MSDAEKELFKIDNTFSRGALVCCQNKISFDYSDWDSYEKVSKNGRQTVFTKVIGREAYYILGQYIADKPIEGYNVPRSSGRAMSDGYDYLMEK